MSDGIPTHVNQRRELANLSAVAMVEQRPSLVGRRDHQAWRSGLDDLISLSCSALTHTMHGTSTERGWTRIVDGSEGAQRMLTTHK
jgi:hypothetical protein